VLMARVELKCLSGLPVIFLVLVGGAADAQRPPSPIGREVAIPRHLQNGEEFALQIDDLIQFGRKLFTAKWTIQEGQGRPLSKGTGDPLSDLLSPLVFPRNFNRLSGPDSNSCSGCHNEPFVGGSGDRVTEVFVLAQRFDFVTMIHSDTTRLRGSLDELGNFATLESVSNERKTLGMNGSGFIEMLARQMTAELQAIRDRTPPAGRMELISKGVSFGVIQRRGDGTWDTAQVEGLPAPSLVTSGQSTRRAPLFPFANLQTMRSTITTESNRQNASEMGLTRTATALQMS